MTPEGGAAPRSRLPGLGASAGAEDVVQGEEEWGWPEGAQVESKGRGWWSRASGAPGLSGRPSQPGGLLRRRQKQKPGGRPPPLPEARPSPARALPPALQPSPISSPTPQASPAAPSGGRRASRLQPGLSAAEMLGVGTGKSWKPLRAGQGGQFQACWRAGRLLRASNPAPIAFPNAYIHLLLLHPATWRVGRELRPKPLFSRVLGSC
ncbi:uncharacterized protein LOC134738264 [Pongo pygmaeus]|uniref:uncharacterized protein LOC134738264 n=1 Tax=Pongo pygmaeus TaxID=9600 RepID=UPI00300D3E24